MNKKQKKMIFRIAVTVLMMLAIRLFVDEDSSYSFLFYLVPYLVIGHDILSKALKGIVKGQVFDENFLMALATVGAFGLREYSESVAVMLFYQIGEFFQDYAVRRSRKNISELMDIRPDYAWLLKEDGEIEKVDPYEVEIGSHIVVKVGDKVPIDGIVEDGESSLNTTALTGESKPQYVKAGDEVISGCINMTAVLKIKTTKAFEESTASKILDLVENASSNKSKSEDFISRFARYYTPIVCLGALLLAFLPPLFNIVMHRDAMFSEWIYRALTFLVISCPCALVISIPLSFFGGIGGASRRGILVKGSNYLEALSKTRYVAFDKTGTMTKGVFEVSAYHECRISEEELLEYAAYAESFSNHPIGQSIVRKYGKDIDKEKIESVTEIPGQGVKAHVLGKDVLAGNRKLFEANNIKAEECSDHSTIVYVAVDGQYVGHIHIADLIKPTARDCIDGLKKAGIRETVMMTGDKESVAMEVAQKLGIDKVFSELLPQDKMEKLEELLKAKASDKETLLFVGDGINDAPVISRADVGVAMGALGSDAAIEAADIVLMDDDPLKIVTAIKIARKCLRIVYENIWFAIGVKVICLILGAFGIANMWLAIFADVGVMVIAVINAIRALDVRNL
ncbi:MAG: cadmium-translocating P-type ATPase [Erysipelotrichaceae bacterium]|nr:cadmium-translocating P-type ATPase [Erysipelotrichaceae bacterium]